MRTANTLNAIVISLTCLAAASIGAVKPGDKAPEFAAADIAGEQHSLNEYLGKGPVVLTFIATACPISNDYNERMVHLHETYGDRGVAFVGINSNREEEPDEIREHAAKNGFRFTILKDVGNTIADAYGAMVTPEVFVVDPAGTIRYHGRIDDSRDPDDITSRDLEAALDALLAGKDVQRMETKAFGCSIKRVKKSG